MNKEEIRYFVKQDLRMHPEKRNNMQFCVACAAYGVDLDDIDKELEQDKNQLLDETFEKAKYGTKVYTKDEVIEIIKTLSKDIKEHQEFQSYDSCRRLVSISYIDIETVKALDRIRSDK